MVPVALRAITVADEGAVASFPCRNPWQPWTDDVESDIRNVLIDAIASEEMFAMGAWVTAPAGALLGVSAWIQQRQPMNVARSELLAVHPDHRRAGIARMLKQRLIDDAFAAGAVAVTSKVHRDNAAMLELNRSFGANVEFIGDEEEYVLCVVPLLGHRTNSP